MDNILTVGYQLIIELDERDSYTKDNNGIITATTDQNLIYSGTVKQMGSLVKKETPEVDIGDKVFFYQTDVRMMKVDNYRFGIINTGAIKAVKKQ